MRDSTFRSETELQKIPSTIRGESPKMMVDQGWTSWRVGELEAKEMKMTEEERKGAAEFGINVRH